MSTFICPFCSSQFVLTKQSFQQLELYFSKMLGYPEVVSSDYVSNKINVNFYRCPNCNEESIRIYGFEGHVKGQELSFRPRSFAKSYPDYIPKQIRTDYEEACSIIELSPKASATLSRRCLQGMIRDYWGITNKNNLYQEILAIEDKVSPNVSRVLKGLKDLGNIGAHMEKDINLIIDIDSGEAEKLIKLIEYLMKEWYINRHESEQLFKDIVGIDEAKKMQKTNGKS